MNQSVLSDDERIALYAPFFDANWYLDRYRDVASWAGPLIRHFVLHGESEDRDPNSFFSTGWVRESRPDMIESGFPFATFLQASIDSGIRPLPCIDITLLSRTHPELTTTAEVMTALLAGRIEPECEWFTESDYLALNPDVRESMAAHEHLLAFGLHEGRLTSRHVKLIAVNSTSRREDSFDVLDSFAWNEQRWIVVRRGPSSDVLAQIDQQGAIDPRVWAPGADAVAGLEVYRSTDLLTRTGVEVAPLVELTTLHHDVVIVLPSVGFGGSEKYFSMLAGHLAATRGWQVTLLTTSDTEDMIAANQVAARGAELDHVRVISVARVCRSAYQPEWILALLLLNLRARWVIVSNSGPGYLALTRYGRALSTVSQLTATFFAETPRVQGNPFTATFADRVIDHAHLLSDNQNLLNQLSARLSPFALGGRAHVLAQQVEAPELDLAIVESRAQRISTHGHLQVLWFSRWERLKNTVPLMKAAEQLSDATITAFGPGTESVHVTTPNLVLRPAVPSPDSIDLWQFDCMLFTSKSEGMPNAVLEMVSRGLPVITPRVGGLQETFDDTAVWFYDNADSDDDTAAAIVRAIEEFGRASKTEIVTRTLAAREQLMRRHSPEAFAHNVSTLLAELGITDEQGGDR